MASATLAAKLRASAMRGSLSSSDSIEGGAGRVGTAVTRLEAPTAAGAGAASAAAVTAARMAATAAAMSAVAELLAAGVEMGTREPPFVDGCRVDGSVGCACGGCEAGGDCGGGGDGNDDALLLAGTCAVGRGGDDAPA